MSIQRLSQVHVSTTDIQRAIAFYRDVLGLQLLFEVPDQGMAFFDVDGVRLYLGTPEGEDFRSTPLLYFEVIDIESEWVKMDAAGVDLIDTPHLVHETAEYALWMTFFRNADGHVNALTEHRSTRTEHLEDEAPSG